MASAADPEHFVIGSPEWPASATICAIVLCDASVAAPTTPGASIRSVPFSNRALCSLRYNLLAEGSVATATPPGLHAAYNKAASAAIVHTRFVTSTTTASDAADATLASVSAVGRTPVAFSTMVITEDSGSGPRARN